MFIKNKKNFILMLFLFFTPFLSKDFSFDKKNSNLVKNEVSIEKTKVGAFGSGLVLDNGNGTNTFYGTDLYNNSNDYSFKWLPIDVDGDGIIGNEKIINFDVANEHVLILVDNGDETRTVYSIGDNDYGQLGDGTKTKKDTPIPIDVDGDGEKGNERIVDIKAKNFASAALIDNNNNFNDGAEELWVWGLNSYWIFSYEEKVLIPRKLPLESYLNNDKKIKLFENHQKSYSLVINDNKNNKDILYTWGQNNYGQLGDGTNFEIIDPTPIDVDGDGNFGNEEIIDIEKGVFFSAALLKDIDGNKILYTWGQNNYGQLGNGTNDHKYKPTPIDVDGDGTIGNEKIIDLSFGGYHSSALSDNGDGTKTLYTWGRNDDGQLGDGTFVNKNIPTPIDIDGDGTIGNEKITNISLDNWTSSVNLEKEGPENNFYVWGLNANGSFGNGVSSGGSNKPILITLENLFNFLVIDKNQTNIIFELSTTFYLELIDKNNLVLYDQNNFDYKTTYNSIDDNYTIQNLTPGVNYFFNYISFSDGVKYDIRDFFNILTDYEIKGIESWSATSTTAEINLDVVSTNFGAFSEWERTIELEYNSMPIDSKNDLKSFNKEKQEVIVNKEGLINLNNLSRGTIYEITKINYNKKTDGSFKYSVNINDNNEIATTIEALYLKDINDTFIIIEESITSNSFKFVIEVYDEGKKFEKYNFIYLFFKNYKGGESPILAYKTNPSKSGSGIYEFEVRNLSSSTTYEFIGISIDRVMFMDDANKSEKFIEEKTLATKINSRKSYLYIFLILFLLILLAFTLMFFVFKSMNSYKNIFDEFDNWQ